MTRKLLFKTKEPAATRPGRRLLFKNNSAGAQKAAPLIHEFVKVGPPLVHGERKPLIIKQQHVEQVLNLIPDLTILEIKEFVDDSGLEGILFKLKNSRDFVKINITPEVVGFEYAFKPDGQCFVTAYNYDFPIVINEVIGDTISLSFYRVEHTKTPELWFKGINNLRRHLRFVLYELSQEAIYYLPA